MVAHAFMLCLAPLRLFIEWLDIDPAYVTMADPIGFQHSSLVVCSLVQPLKLQVAMLPFVDCRGLQLLPGSAFGAREIAMQQYDSQAP